MRPDKVPLTPKEYRTLKAQLAVQVIASSTFKANDGTIYDMAEIIMRNCGLVEDEPKEEECQDT